MNSIVKICMSVFCLSMVVSTIAAEKGNNAAFVCSSSVRMEIALKDDKATGRFIVGACAYFKNKPYQKGNIEKYAPVIDFAEKARTRYLTMMLIEVCLPANVVKDYIKPHLAEWAITAHTKNVNRYKKLIRINYYTDKKHQKAIFFFKELASIIRLCEAISIHRDLENSCVQKFFNDNQESDRRGIIIQAIQTYVKESLKDREQYLCNQK
jgi:hypothetical protein